MLTEEMHPALQVLGGNEQAVLRVLCILIAFRGKLSLRAKTGRYLGQGPTRLLFAQDANVQASNS